MSDRFNTVEGITVINWGGIFMLGAIELGMPEWMAVGYFCGVFVLGLLLLFSNQIKSMLSPSGEVMVDE